ncbi:MAG: ClpX C4-type zinc finger protein [Bacteroidales bacterium]
MVLTPELLEQARRAAARLQAAEKDALVARGDYHTAVRRLHLAGASLREIAEALSLSHQRVQQIVKDAGGSWWSRAWRSRRLPPEAVCTWCARPPAEVAKLIAGPNVFICDRCTEAAESAAAGTPAGAFRLRRRSFTARCAFCGKRAAVAAKAGNVCAACLDACRAILEGTGKPR